MATIRLQPSAEKRASAELEAHTASFSDTGKVNDVVEDDNAPTQQHIYGEEAGADVGEEVGVDTALGAASIGLDATGVGVGVALGSRELFMREYLDQTTAHRNPS